MPMYIPSKLTSRVVLARWLFLVIVTLGSPASIASIQLDIEWSLPSRFWFDQNADGRPDIPNSREYILNLDGKFTAPKDGADTMACTTSSAEIPLFRLDLKAFNQNTSPTVSESSRYEWTIRGRSNATSLERTSIGPRVSVCLEEGTYDVSVSSTQNATSLRTEKVVPVEDVLIVSIGDSFSSGEGNPEKRLFNPSSADSFSTIDQRYVAPIAGNLGVPIFVQWADSGAPLSPAGTTPPTRPNAEHVKAHRSTLAWPVQYARMVEAAAKGKVSVTLVFLAASGATIHKGLLGPYAGTAKTPPLDDNLPPQLDQARYLVAKRRVDVLLLTIGGNDIGFSSIPKALLLRRPSNQCVSFNVIESAIQSGNWRQVGDASESGDCGSITWARTFGLDLLPGWPDNVLGLTGLPFGYSDLIRKLGGTERSLEELGNVFILTYPSPVHKKHAPCDKPILTEVVDTIEREVGKTEIDWLATWVIPKLANQINDAARRGGWFSIASPDVFLDHGLCVGGSVSPDFKAGLYTGNYTGNPYPGDLPPYTSNTRFFRRAKEAAGIQGPYVMSGKRETTGTLHPNEYGHLELAKSMLSQVELPIHLPNIGLQGYFDTMAVARSLLRAPDFNSVSLNDAQTQLQMTTSVRLYRLQASARSTINVGLDLPAGTVQRLAIRIFDSKGRPYTPPTEPQCSAPKHYKLAYPRGILEVQSGVPHSARTTETVSAGAYIEEAGDYYIGVSYAGNDSYDPTYGWGRRNPDFAQDSPLASRGLNFRISSSSGSDPDNKIPCAALVNDSSLGTFSIQGHAIEDRNDVDLFEVRLSAAQRLSVDVSSKYASACPLSLGPFHDPLEPLNGKPATSGLQPEVSFFEKSGKHIATSATGMLDYVASGDGPIFVGVSSKGRFPYGIVDTVLEPDIAVSPALPTQGQGNSSGSYRACISIQ
jgi:hypothetical protein